jgi:hypothetical protein
MLVPNDSKDSSSHKSQSGDTSCLHDFRNFVLDLGKQENVSAKGGLRKTEAPEMAVDRDKTMASTALDGSQQ